jgi:hypothetical protein
MNVFLPLPSNKAANCVDLMLNNYKNCKSRCAFQICSEFFLTKKLLKAITAALAVAFRLAVLIMSSRLA